MKKGKLGLVIFVFALLFAGIAAYSATTFINSHRNTVLVVALAKDISAHTKLTKEDLILQEIPQALKSAEYFDSVDEVVGSYTKAAMVKGSLLKKGQLADFGSDSIAYPLTEDHGGKRAFAIPGEYFLNFGDGVKEGDRLDLIGTFAIEKDSFAKTIARNVPVLRKETEENRYVIVVSDQQAEEIALALTAGKLFITVTPYGENEPVEEQALSGTYLQQMLQPKDEEDREHEK